METINTELILADLETIEKRITKIEKEVRSGDKNAIALKDILEKYKAALENEKMANTVELEDKEKELTKELQLLTNKPILYVVNVSENQKVSNENILPSVDNKIFLPIQFELELAELPPEEAEIFRAEADLDPAISSMEYLTTRCYELLGLITFLTTGKDETRAWTIKKARPRLRPAAPYTAISKKNSSAPALSIGKNLLTPDRWETPSKKDFCEPKGRNIS